VPNLPRLIVLKLGGKIALPALPKTPPYVWAPPKQFGTPADIAAGGSNFQRYCLVCHGPGAVGNGVLPDLRKSGAIADAAVWKSVVIDGILKGNGMVSFSSVLTQKEAEQMRAYVVSRAHYAKTNDAALGGGSKKAVK
jgi:quinohemoprotein ethanol dehydrogenase